MKLKQLPKIRARNTLALHPLLHKGGVHAKDDISHQRKQERQKMKQRLRAIIVDEDV